MKASWVSKLQADEVLLPVCILSANTENGNLWQTAITAVVGGVIWLGFKLLGDYITKKLRDKNRGE